MDIGEFLKKNYKFIIPIVILVFILIILLMLNSLKSLMPESNRAELDRIRNLKFDSIKELLEYYECEYINLENYISNLITFHHPIAVGFPSCILGMTVCLVRFAEGLCEALVLKNQITIFYRISVDGFP